MQTKKHSSLFRLFAIGAVLCAAIAFVRAADELKKEEPKKKENTWQQLKPEKLVSDNTFLYVVAPDMKRLKAAFLRTAFHGLVSEDEVSNLLQSSFSKLNEVYVKGDGTRSPAEQRRHKDEADLLMKIAPLVDGQFAFAIDGDGDLMTFLNSGKLPRFLVIASMPSGDAGFERQQALEDILEKHRYEETQDAAHYRDFDEKVGAYEVHRIENQQLDVVETWAFVENLFIYGQGKHIVEDAIERYGNNGAGSLAVHSGYQGAYREVGHDERGDALLYLQVDSRSLFKQKLIDPTVGPLLAAFPSIKSMLDAKAGEMEANRPHLALGVTIAEGDKAAIREKFILRVGKDAMPKSAEPCDAVTARFAQNDTLFFSAVQSNLAEWYKQFIDNIKGSQPELATTIDQKVKSSIGVQGDAELMTKLEGFKGEMGLFFSTVSQPNLKMDKLSDYLEFLQPVIAIEMDSGVLQQSVKNMFTSIETKSGHVYEKTNVAAGTNNVTIFYQKDAAPDEPKLPDNEPGMLVNMTKLTAESKYLPFFTTYAQVDLEVEPGKTRKFLLLSDSINAIKKAVQQSQMKFAHTSLFEDAKFKGLARNPRTFRDRRNAISYLDLSKLADVYSAELPRVAKMGLIRREVLREMPSATSMRDHLFPMAWANSVLADPEGLLIETSSPLGNLSMAGAIGGVAWPYVNARRMQEISEKVDEKFKRLFLALHLYAADFDHYPQQFSDLIPNYILEKDFAAVFESPFKVGAVKSPTDVDDPEKTNLVYMINRQLQDQGDLILVYEKQATSVKMSNDGTKLFHHILRVDGKRTFLTKTALELNLSGKADFITKAMTEAPETPKK